jgi:preprotein translocase subunit SecG
MLLFVTLLHIILCFVLILVILLQPGKGSDVGAAFGGGGGSSTIFGPRGAGSFLSQATTIVAILFMFTSVTLALYSNASVQSGSNVEDAMNRRLARERIEGDAYKVPEGGIGGEPAPVEDVGTGGEVEEPSDVPATTTDPGAAAPGEPVQAPGSPVPAAPVPATPPT